MGKESAAVIEIKARLDKAVEIAKARVPVGERRKICEQKLGRSEKELERRKREYGRCEARLGELAGLAAEARRRMDEIKTEGARLEAEQQALEEEMGALVVPQRRAPPPPIDISRLGLEECDERLRRK